MDQFRTIAWMPCVLTLAATMACGASVSPEQLRDEEAPEDPRESQDQAAADPTSEAPTVQAPATMAVPEAGPPTAAEPAGTPSEVADETMPTDGTSVSAGTRMIDDMDPTNDLLQVPGGGSTVAWETNTGAFIGNWFLTWSDGRSGDAALARVEPPRDENTQAYHVDGAELGVEAVLWLELDHAFGRAVNLSDYEGISFWARLNSPSGRLVVTFGYGRQFFDVERDGAPETVLSASDEWHRFDVSFDESDQDVSAVTSIDFGVGEGGESFELWIDDLALTCRETCP